MKIIFSNTQYGFAGVLSSFVLSSGKLRSELIIRFQLSVQLTNNLHFDPFIVTFINSSAF